MISKSGVSGLLTFLDPETGTSFCVACSPLDERGNSALGMELVTEMAQLPKFKAFQKANSITKQ
jgi:glutaminase